MRAWRTQRQNETLLNQAFNTKTEVYLVFCARQAREIFGIARYRLLPLFVLVHALIDFKNGGCDPYNRIPNLRFSPSSI